MAKFYTFIFLFLVFDSFSQNELYNNGGLIYVNGRISTAVATLRVNGTITNNDGYFNNAGGLIELTGDWANTVSSYNYTSTGMERFTGGSGQTISGTWNGTSSNQNQFYDLVIKKSASTGEIISLGTDVNVNANGSLSFESTNGIIRTDNTSHTNNGSLYAYILNLLNVDPSKFTNYSTGAGATTKYIEGKLKRSVDQTSTYYYPIGVASTSLDGMEAFEIAFNPPGIPTIFPATGILGYIQPAANPSINIDLITNGDILFYDIGSFIDPNNNFSQCIGTPDGHDDVALIDQAITHEWLVTPDAGTTFDYNIHFYPGTNLDNLTYATMGAPCNSVYTQAKYLARNGRIGGNGAVGPTINYWVPGVYGLYQSPTGNILSNQTGFSRFRIFAASDNNTSLPVELIYLQANAIDNEFIKVSWTTASEKNNRGVVLQRSTNGTSWDSIAWLPGNGTSNITHNYFFDDHNVEKGIVYYYRLKQIDFTNNHSYSRTVSAQLIPSNIESVIIFPNPSNSNSIIQLLSPVDKEFQIDTYNALGQLMSSAKVAVKKNILTKVDLPSNDWAKGVYMVNIQSSNKKELKGIRFIKE